MPWVLNSRRCSSVSRAFFMGCCKSGKCVRKSIPGLNCFKSEALALYFPEP